MAYHSPNSPAPRPKHALSNLGTADAVVALTAPPPIFQRLSSLLQYRRLKIPFKKAHLLHPFKRLVRFSKPPQPIQYLFTISCIDFCQASSKFCFNSFNSNLLTSQDTPQACSICPRCKLQRLPPLLSVFQLARKMTYQNVFNFCSLRRRVCQPFKYFIRHCFIPPTTSPYHRRRWRVVRFSIRQVLGSPAKSVAYFTSLLGTTYFALTSQTVWFYDASNIPRRRPPLSRSTVGALAHAHQRRQPTWW